MNYTTSDNRSIVFTVNYTIAAAGASYDVTSASLTISEQSSAAPDQTNAQRAVQASVSRSQSAVAGTNIGTRIATVADAAGQGTVGGAVPETTTGTPSEGIEVDPRTPEENPEANFSTTRVRSRGDAQSAGQTGTTLRELAMVASFDTSRPVLAAAGDDQGPILAPDQRGDVLKDRDLTLWGHGSFTDVKNDLNDGNQDNRYSGDIWGYNLGIDYRFQQNLVAGMSVGYSVTDLTTVFNSGTYDETAWTLSPYAIYQPLDGLAFSFIGGLATGDVDRTRDSGVTGKTDSSQIFASLKASYTIQPAEGVPLDLTAELGFLASHKTLEQFTESDGTVVEEATTNTRQLTPGVEASYTFDLSGTGIAPFLATEYVRDFTD